MIDENEVDRVMVRCELLRLTVNRAMADARKEAKQQGLSKVETKSLIHLRASAVLKTFPDPTVEARF
jgi:hypothetical protein